MQRYAVPPRPELVLLCASLVLGGCANDDDGGRRSPEETGSVCEVDDDCFGDLDVQGDALCLDRVRAGYCTHTCASDDDCCAVPGECRTDFAQVCSPFESANQMMCFLSCERADIDASGSDAVDEQQYCQREGSPDFICRSSGGGSNNRKVCVPGDCGVGASCGSDEACAGDLVCVTGLPGGYCTRRDCSSDADCPDDARCVASSLGANVCYRACAGDSDCGFCRSEDVAGRCTSDVEFVDASSSGSVCSPD